MATIKGSETVEIDAPIERCYAIVADLEATPDWQPTMVDSEVLERDGEGRHARVRTVNDAKVKKATSTLRFSHHPPTRMTWTQEKGDLKSVEGSWELEDLGDERTRATFSVAVDPGRVLGMAIRGPVEGQVRQMLLGGAASGLKARAESGAEG